MAELYFAERILMERTQRKWVQEEMARRVGVSQGQISRYENAEDLPSLEVVCKFADAFGLEVSRLFQRRDAPVPPETGTPSRAHDELWRELLLLPESLAQTFVQSFRVLNALLGTASWEAGTS